MEIQKLIEICQWDFQSYSDALINQEDIIIYKKLINPPLKAHDPQQPVEFIQTETCQIRVGTEPFGFYSWMPSCENDRALVLEHKAKPKPWTDYKLPNDELGLLVNSISSLIESLIAEDGLLVGVSCVGAEIYPDKYQIMFAKSKRNPLPIYMNFSVFFGDLINKTKEQKIDYLCHTVDAILHERKNFLKQQLIE